MTRSPSQKNTIQNIQCNKGNAMVIQYANSCTLSILPDHKHSNYRQQGRNGAQTFISKHTAIVDETGTMK